MTLLLCSKIVAPMCKGLFRLTLTGVMKTKTRESDTILLPLKPVMFWNDDLRDIVFFLLENKKDLPEVYSTANVFWQNVTSNGLGLSQSIFRIVDWQCLKIITAKNWFQLCRTK